MIASTEAFTIVFIGELCFDNNGTLQKIISSGITGNDESEFNFFVKYLADIGFQLKEESGLSLAVLVPFKRLFSKKSEVTPTTPTLSKQEFSALSDKQRIDIAGKEGTLKKIITSKVVRKRDSIKVKSEVRISQNNENPLDIGSIGFADRISIRYKASSFEDLLNKNNGTMNAILLKKGNKSLYKAMQKAWNATKAGHTLQFSIVAKKTGGTGRYIDNTTVIQIQRQ